MKIRIYVLCMHGAHIYIYIYCIHMWLLVLWLLWLKFSNHTNKRKWEGTTKTKTHLIIFLVDSFVTTQKSSQDKRAPLHSTVSPHADTARKVNKKETYIRQGFWSPQNTFNACEHSCVWYSTRHKVGLNPLTGFVSLRSYECVNYFFNVVYQISQACKYGTCQLVLGYTPGVHSCTCAFPFVRRQASEDLKNYAEKYVTALRHKASELGATQGTRFITDKSLNNYLPLGIPSPRSDQ